MAFKLSKPEKNLFVKVNIYILYTFFISMPKKCTTLYETLDTLIEALTAFTVRQP